jgi:hypothetical protein
MEVLESISCHLAGFALRAVCMLAVPFVLCLIASAIRIRWFFLQLGCMGFGLLLGLVIPLPTLAFSSPQTAVFCFGICYLVVLMLIVHLPRVMTPIPERRRAVAVLIVLILLAVFGLRQVSSAKLVL